MGLFDVNMPMIYGEGKTKAFLRLQEEILKVSSDHSIFAWRDENATAGSRTGLLATSPDMFKNSGGFFSYHEWETVEPFIRTNRGLQITLPLRPVEPGVFVAALNCPKPSGSDGFVGIYLQAMSSLDRRREGGSDRRYARIRSDDIVAINNISDRGNTTNIVVCNSGAIPPQLMIYPDHIVQLRHGPDPGLGWTIYGTMGIVSKDYLIFKSKDWIPRGLDHAFWLSKKPRCLAAVIVFSRPDESKLTILLGSGNSVEDVGIEIVNGSDDQTFGEWARRFHPQARDRSNPWEFAHERVYVNTDWQVFHSRKYHVVDITVQLNHSLDDGETNMDETRQIASIVPEVQAARENGSSRLRRLIKRLNPGL